APGAGAPERAAASAFAATCEDLWGVSPVIQDSAGEGAPIVLTIQDPAATDGPARDGYSLSIAPDGVTITGNSASGLYYGIVTLTQIAQSSPEPGLPALEITDAPDF